MKDAFVLGRLLAYSLTTLDNVSAGLRAYQDVRLPAAQSVARNSKDLGRMYQFDAPGYYDGTDRGNERKELEILQERIISHIESYGEGSAIAEWQQVESNLRGSLRNDCKNDVL